MNLRSELSVRSLPGAEILPLARRSQPLTVGSSDFLSSLLHSEFFFSLNVGIIPVGGPYL